MPSTFDREKTIKAILINRLPESIVYEFEPDSLAMFDSDRFNYEQLRSKLRLMSNAELEREYRNDFPSNDDSVSHFSKWFLDYINKSSTRIPSKQKVLKDYYIQNPDRRKTLTIRATAFEEIWNKLAPASWHKPGRRLK